MKKNALNVRTQIKSVEDMMMKPISVKSRLNLNNVSQYKMIKQAFAALSLSALCVPSANAIEILKFMVSEPGMQRVSYEDLPSGFNLSGLKHSKFNVMHDGEFIEVRIVGQERGSNRFFGPGGYIEFYAEPADNLYTEENVYSLHYLTNRELREVGSRRISDSTVATNPDAASSTTYFHTEVVEENTYYDFAAPSQTDPWHYGQNFSFFPTPTYSFELTDVVGGTASATVSAQMYGLLDFELEGNDHHYEVVVNDILLGDQQFDGSSIDEFSAQNAVVNEGANTFQYNYRPIAGVPFDLVALNRISVTYPRVTKAVDNSLDGEFAAGHHRVTSIEPGDSFGVYKIDQSNDGAEPIVTRMSSASAVDGGNIVFNAANQPGRYIVVGEEGFETPRIQQLLVRQNISEGAAEYLIIAHPSLMGENLDRLVELRSQQYSVKVVDVSQVYEQFGDGLADSNAIYEYIKHASDNLDTRFVVLVGNDTYDYKEFGATGSVSLLPTPYRSTPGGFFLVTQTPSDASYGDVNEDGVLDLPYWSNLSKN